MINTEQPFDIKTIFTNTMSKIEKNILSEEEKIKLSNEAILRLEGRHAMLEDLAKYFEDHKLKVFVEEIEEENNKTENSTDDTVAAEKAEEPNA